MSNTNLRVISAVVMVALLIGIVSLGALALTYFLIFLGVLLIDEILVNFLQIKRFSLSYITAEGLFSVVAIFFFVLDHSANLVDLFNNAALVNNCLLLIYLFYVAMDNLLVLTIAKKIPYLVALYIFLPLSSMAYIVALPEWKSLLLILLVINFGMDTGAWLVGKNFGRHKLWPAVSPNKTIEGTLGGVIIAGILGSISWFWYCSQVSLVTFFLFAFLGLLSQLGDLVQSKLKRQCGIKDSSQLIPGHGGVYDRLDSLLFVAPFFVLVLNYIA